MSEGSYMGDNPLRGFSTFPHHTFIIVKQHFFPDSADEIPIFLNMIVE